MTDPQTIVEGMTRANCVALLSAVPGEGGFWRIPYAPDVPGYRGLPGLGLVYSSAQAARIPGSRGRLTELGLAVRTHLEKELKK